MDYLLSHPGKRYKQEILIDGKHYFELPGVSLDIFITAKRVLKYTYPMC